MSHEEIKNIIKKQKSLNKDRNSNGSSNSNEYKLIKNTEHDEMEYINKNSINDNHDNTNTNTNLNVNSKEIEDLNKEIYDLGMENDNTLDVNESNENMEDLKQQILDN